MAVLYVRKVATADASLAAIFERSKFGMAIAAMIRMIATTISNSISEKPFCCFFQFNWTAPFSSRKTINNVVATFTLGQCTWDAKPELITLRIQFASQSHQCIEVPHEDLHQL